MREDDAALLIKFVDWCMKTYGFIIPINLVMLFIASQQEKNNEAE